MKSIKGRMDEAPTVSATPQRKVELPAVLYPAYSRCRDLLAELEKARASPVLYGTAKKLSSMPAHARLTSNCVSALRELAAGESNEFALSEDELEALKEADELRRAGRLSMDAEGTFVGLLCPEERLLLIEAMLPAYRQARTKNHQGET